jgi:signal peptidase I
MSGATSNTAATGVEQASSNSGIEGFQGLLMAFMMALVFRGFIIEGFHIPTGSMAPTLMGQHTLLHGDTSGLAWPVGPVTMQGRTGVPAPTQSFTTSDPVTLAETRVVNAPLRSGDRVFILKYLFPVFTPSRCDVVVFKNPRDPTMSYIKRLVGLGPEEVALVDGDVFSRPLAPDAPPEAATTNTWELPGWKVARKPDDSQTAMWQLVFDSAFTPLDASRDGRTWFKSPWAPAQADAAAWKVEGQREYRYEGQGPTTLAWDPKRRISDAYPYNQLGGGQFPNGHFPVSDVRVSLHLEPVAAGTTAAMTLATRRHVFRAAIEGGERVTLAMRRDDQTDWRTIGEGSLTVPLAAGQVRQVEFWHVDQSLRVVVDGRTVARGEYDWSPAERLEASMGLAAKEVFETRDRNLLTDAARITPAQVSLEFAGGPLTLRRVRVDRDIHYQPGDYHPVNDTTAFGPSGPHSRARQPAAGTHPRQPVFLADGEYFMCGDNSPASLDARLWEKPSPWVESMDPHTGVVHRDAMVGKAFVVYWPGPDWKWGVVPVPDFGRVRQIK